MNVIMKRKKKDDTISHGTALVQSCPHFAALPETTQMSVYVTVQIQKHH